MFKKILFATTASPTCDDAAKVAFDLAVKYKAELHLLHVYGVPTRGFGAYATDVRTGEQDEYGEEYVEWVEEEIRTTYEKQLAKTENCTIHAQLGVSYTEILRTARKLDVDLIVMGAHNREEDPGATRFRNVLGSTMQRVAQKARCPVLIVSRPCQNCFWYFSNIVLGVDFTKASMSAFLFALKVANVVGCKLYLFHALDLSGIQVGKMPGQPAIEKEIEATRKSIEEMYVPKMDGFDNYEIEIWEGVPYVEILKYARDRQADLIVMAHHTRDIDPDEALLGSTVEQVVLRAAAPVASVNRPDKVA